MKDVTPEEKPTVLQPPYVPSIPLRRSPYDSSESIGQAPIEKPPALVLPAAPKIMPEPEKPAPKLEIKPAPAEQGVAEQQILMVRADQLIPNRFQPRKTFDKESLTELIESIKSAGVLQPIIVRKSQAKSGQVENYYEIVAGERRWRACLELKIASVPVIVKEVNDQKMLEWALIENTQRKDLNPIEKSRAYKELMTFFNLTQEEIAKRVGLDRATVANFIRLLDLPTEVQDEIAKGTISSTHARGLLAINEPALQIKLAQRIRKEGMSVRRLEYVIRWLKRHRPQVTTFTTFPVSGSPERLHLREIEDRLRRKFNTKVIISSVDSKQGQLIISFYSVDDFQRLLDMLDKIP